MVGRIARGEVWLHELTAPDKRRPVLVLSRPKAIEMLSTVVVAPISSTIRGVPSEVVLGVDHGMKATCAINLDHVQTVRQHDLKRYVATLPPDVMAAACRALAVATACA